ncbi:GNAT family N-acetyltransferase [Lentzea tibetensis]|uniref:GNAT family N-acetyltransferase n=1 Tax=Lentzea tibetensis TaxID=2591470 RepID=A0A563ESN3_9PSEU|nr:GNAT family N-acetyltransferase [Lentzea tibetensis]TWP50660.1 GNAT family N-acetyltransferase [Lentzea tibetensis]
MFMLTDLTARDRAGLLAMVERCSPRSRHARFHSTSPTAATDHVATLFTDPDSRTVVARERGVGIVAFGSLLLYGNGLAEIALLVEDSFQGRGIGRLLTNALHDHATAEGVSALELTALAGNTRILRLFRTARFSPADAGTVHGLLPIAA